jgi:hypothetical protein
MRLVWHQELVAEHMLQSGLRVDIGLAGWNA